MMEFYITYTGHERNARKLLLDERIIDSESLAVMSSSEVTDLINKNFLCYQVGEDWLIIHKQDETKFNNMIKWIER